MFAKGVCIVIALFGHTSKYWEGCTMLNRQLRAYYRSTMFGNRSTLARVIDFVALRLFIFVALYVWFSLQTAQLTLLSLIHI